MEERHHATTQNRFYTYILNVNKNITVAAKLISPPTYLEKVNKPLHYVIFRSLTLFLNVILLPSHIWDKSNFTPIKENHNFASDTNNYNCSTRQNTVAFY